MSSEWSTYRSTQSTDILQWSVYRFSRVLGSFPSNSANKCLKSVPIFIISILTVVNFIAVLCHVLFLIPKESKTDTDFLLDALLKLGKIVFSGIIITSHYFLTSCKLFRMEEHTKTLTGNLVLKESNFWLKFALLFCGVRVTNNSVGAFLSKSGWLPCTTNLISTVFHVAIFTIVLQLDGFLSATEQALILNSKSDGISTNLKLEKHAKCVEMIYFISRTYGFQVLLVATKALWVAVGGACFIIRILMRMEMTKHIFSFTNECLTVITLSSQIFIMCTRASSISDAVSSHL